MMAPSSAATQAMRPVDHPAGAAGCAPGWPEFTVSDSGFVGHGEDLTRLF